MGIHELKKYISQGNEIEFEFDNRKYSITYFYPDENTRLISFCEFYKKTTEVVTAEELWNDVERYGKTVGEMLSSITMENIYIF